MLLPLEIVDLLLSYLIPIEWCEVWRAPKWWSSHYDFERGFYTPIRNVLTSLSINSIDDVLKTGTSSALLVNDDGRSPRFPATGHFV